MRFTGYFDVEREMSLLAHHKSLTTANSAGLPHMLMLFSLLVQHHTVVSSQLGGGSSLEMALFITTHSVMLKAVTTVVWERYLLCFEKVMLNLPENAYLNKIQMKFSLKELKWLMDLTGV